MVSNLKEATASAREADNAAIKAHEQRSHVLPLAEGATAPPKLPSLQQPGEGIGLSIVKRLCELLDASLELASSVTSGTVFRVVLPRYYE
ncbi:MAG TPA: ATP-binding protein, partial [Opitutus sp.]|nr:ATP-binding protein [Opitutus sp.]